MTPTWTLLHNTIFSMSEISLKLLDFIVKFSSELSLDKYYNVLSMNNHVSDLGLDDLLVWKTIQFCNLF